MRRIVSFSVLALCLCLCATAHENLPLIRLVQCINDSEFLCAAEELNSVEDWTYRVSNGKSFVNINNALVFADWASARGAERSKIQNLCLYVAQQCDWFAQYGRSSRKYDIAISYSIYSAEIRKSILGEMHPDYASSLDNIGLLYSEIGDFSKAEQYYLPASYIYKLVLGETHPEYAASLNNLGNLYRNIGDYPKAEQYYLQSLAILKTTTGENNPDYASALNNLGNLYRNTGDYTKAEQYYLPSIAIMKSAFGERHPQYAALLNNLGLLYTDMGNYAKAEQYYLLAVDIYKSAPRENHPKYAISLKNLGNLYRDIGDSANAEHCYFQSIAILKSAFGENHPDYATALNDIGRLYYKCKDYSKSELYLYRAQEISKSGFLQSLNYMSEQQRNSYWSTIKDRFESTYPLFTYSFSFEKPSISTFAYNNELFTKGLLLTSSNAIKNSILESGDTTLIRQWNELTEKKQQIMVLEEKDPQTAYLTQVKEEAESLEKAITRKSAAYRENMRQWDITWDSVRAVLKPKQVAIEFMRAPLNEDSTMYCALLVRNTCSYPIMIPLFEEKEVSSLLHQTTANKNSINTTYAYDRNGKQLAQLIWNNVLPYINEGEVVFFAPTGILHQIAIENLPFDETNTIGDKYNIVRLSSTRELAISRPAIPNQTATLYGGIFYEPMDSIMLIANASKYRSMETAESNTYANDTTRRSVAKYLPGSKAEIDSIQPILKKKHIAVTVYSKDTACEESLKALSGKKPNILLLSTHGFFWQDSTAKQTRYFSQRDMLLGDGNDVSKFSATIDPLERCGLLFAGANTALSGHSERLPKGVDDGILTAKEISALDFRSTDIVVMSACETGLGDISGEGVFGLQRAFKMAGAKTIMMTLWQVNDRATNLFMTSFFRHYSQGMSKRQAFRMAQQEVRNYTADGTSSGSRSALHEKYKNKGKMGDSSHAPQPPKGGAESSVVSEQGVEVSHPYASPYYWAGFILLD